MIAATLAHWLAIFCLLLTLVHGFDDRPIQHRIALLTDGMTVSWSTIGPLENLPSVNYGLSMDKLDLVETGSTLHYNSSDTWFHHVEIHHLKSNTQYFWQVRTNHSKYSPIKSFTTAPNLQSGDAGNFSVAIYGDLGIRNSENTLNLLRDLADDRIVSLFWHIGDLSYADDHDRVNMTYEQVYEGWMYNMTNIWDETPYMFAVGNHESTGGPNTSLSQKNFTAYRERFHMPYTQSGSQTNMFYSFDYGLVHFINIDTENYPQGPESGNPFGDQATWLRKDLEAATANRANVPWIIVGGHRPFYATLTQYIHDYQKEFFFPIFAGYDIDMIFIGHIHYYERMYAIDTHDTNGTVCSKDYNQPKCPIHVLTGAAGCLEGLNGSNHTAPFSAKIVSEWGVGLLHVNGRESLTWEFVNSQTRKVRDSFTVIKKHQTISEKEEEVKLAQY